MTHLQSTISDSSGFLGAGGEMGELIRAKDWSRTPIGPPAEWPQSLRTAVSLCLASNFPINIIWGPDQTQIYNDGYRDICGAAHPEALGQDYRQTWASAWPVIGEPFELALAGQTSYLENQRMFLYRNGYLEETFFTFSHSPMRDESGGIGGLFHPVTETTATMLSERRTRALRELSIALSQVDGAARLMTTTVEVLSRFEADLPFLLFYEFDAVAGAYRLAAYHGVEPELPLTPLLLEANALAASPFSDALNAATIAELLHCSQYLQGRPCGPNPEAVERAFVMPFRRVINDPPFGFFVAGTSTRLPFTEAYRTFYDLLAVTINGAQTAVRAREDERRRMDALAEIDRAKTEFFSNVSHEFRTPLTLMLGPLEEILIDDSQPYREQLTAVHRNGMRLLRLVNSLLDFSRVEAARANANYQQIDIAAFTAELASNFQSACERAGIALLVECMPTTRPVYLDPEMWEKIILNLLSNAFKFTHAGSIRVLLQAEEEHAVLQIEDTGVGIPADELSRIFERFHRVAAVHGRTHEGSGIGLALVSELVSLLGGTISVESSLGLGTRFCVRVPLGDEHVPADQRNRSSVPAQSSNAADAFVQEALRWLPTAAAPGAITATPPELTQLRPRVLLVDDSADMRDYVRRILLSRYDVILAADGQEALALIAEAPPDLVLSDVMMPRLDGFGLARAMRAQAGLRLVPLILLSARAGDDARVSGADAGADDYLVKPFNANELLARVATNLRVAESRRQAEATVAASERDRRIGQAFQRAALPLALPQVPGMAFSSLYEPASQEANVGGDFYDAFRLLDGRIVLSIGDVVGAGLAAAATMAALRQSIRAVATINPDPQMLLKAADEIFSTAGGPAFASAFVAVVDPLTFSMQYANAGHPPPILRRPDGTTILLEASDLLLGVMPGREQGVRKVHHVLVEPGSLLTLYTDGVTENQRDPIEGETRLRRVIERLSETQLTSQDLAAEMYHATLDSSAACHDDVALMAIAMQQPLLQFTELTVTHHEFHADDGHAAHSVKGEIIKALERSGFTSAALFAVNMIFSELVGNVVRHAETIVKVVLDHTQTFPVLHVFDSGDGFSLNPKLPADAYAERGRGLYIVNQLALDFSVSPRTMTPGSHARAVLQIAD